MESLIGKLQMNEMIQFTETNTVCQIRRYSLPEKIVTDF